MADEVIDLGGVLIVFIFLNLFNFCLDAKCMTLFSQIYITLIPHQISSFHGLGGYNRDACF